ncbi:hypothetical protein R1flu_000049 [Riccia fluitans]|uniref:Myb-like domain-containing protein n=1 Tax=Riccia fluitans TaxID=41844 RepID=A0ABD1XZB6_9MARC
MDIGSYSSRNAVCWPTWGQGMSPTAPQRGSCDVSDTGVCSICKLELQLRNPKHESHRALGFIRFFSPLSGGLQPADLSRSIPFPPNGTDASGAVFRGHRRAFKRHRFGRQGLSFCNCSPFGDAYLRALLVAPTVEKGKMRNEEDSDFYVSVPDTEPRKRKRSKFWKEQGPECKTAYDTGGGKQSTDTSEFHVCTPVSTIDELDVYCGPDTPPLIARPSRRSQKKLFSSRSIMETQRDKGHVIDKESRGWSLDRKRKDLDHGKFTEDELIALNCGLNELMKARKWNNDEAARILTHSSGRGRPHEDARGVWKEVGQYLPGSSIMRVNMKTRSILFKEMTVRSLVRRLVQEYQNDWITISSKLGRSNGACARKWGSIKLDELRRRKRGKWRQKEYDKLCQCVREAKATMILDPSRRAGNRKVKDNLRWEPIAMKMGRPANQCSAVWYYRLAPSMDQELTLSEEERQWEDADDRRLLKRMLRLVSYHGEIYWPKVFLRNRKPATCRARFRQMTTHLKLQFDVNVEVQLYFLVRRYAPDLKLKFKDRQAGP